MNAFHNQKPLYLQVKEKIEEAILTGMLKPNEALPSIRNLATDYQLNPVTISNTIDALVSEEILFTKRGSGTFVSEDARARIISHNMNGFIDFELTPVIKKAYLYGLAETIIYDITKFIYGGNNE